MRRLVPSRRTPSSPARRFPFLAARGAWLHRKCPRDNSERTSHVPGVVSLLAANRKSVAGVALARASVVPLFVSLFLVFVNHLAETRDHSIARSIVMTTTSRSPFGAAVYISYYL